MELKTKESQLKTSEVLKKADRKIKIKRQMQRTWVKSRKEVLDRAKLRSVNGSTEGPSENESSYAENRVEATAKRAVRQGKELTMSQAKRHRQKKRFEKGIAATHDTRNPAYAANIQSVHGVKKKAPGVQKGAAHSPESSMREELRRKQAIKQLKRKRHIQSLRRHRSAPANGEAPYTGSFANPVFSISNILKFPVSKGANYRKKPMRLNRIRRNSLSYLAAAAIVLIIIMIFAASMGLYGSEENDNIPVNGTLVEIAESQIGNVGGVKYWSWYGFTSHVDWCACFVSWCCDKAGYIEDGTAPKFSYCQDGVNWFISKKSWYSGRIEPKPGMIIFFDWDGNGEANHVGIVKECKEGLVYTIEGNSGDRCKENQYAVGNRWIMGYGAIAIE